VGIPSLVGKHLSSFLSLSLNVDTGRGDAVDNPVGRSFQPPASSSEVEVLVRGSGFIVFISVCGIFGKVKSH
jgi:hypothetical protein